MDAIKWVRVVKDLRVPAQPEGLWTLALEFVGSATKIRITTPEKLEEQDKWSYAKDSAAKCGPNGDRTSFLPSAKCVNPKAPVGALIGKIGGGTADVEGEMTFVVGSHCVLELKQDKGIGGSLFLTMNDRSDGYGDNDGGLVVQIDVSYQGRTEGT